MKPMLVVTATCATMLLAASPEDRAAVREANKAVVQREYEENLKRYRDNPDVLVLPALVANRRTKQVHVVGEATGIGKNDPIEFFLIAEDSGRDYEAIAFSFARPSDIHKALEFIGLSPGRPVDYGKLCFWPKGERVFVSFKLRATDAREVRAESLVIDLRTGKPLPQKGLVFVGSILVETPEKPGAKVYAADAHEPKAIAANYNELTTVLDVPYQAPQSEVYRHQMANPEFLLPRGALLDILMEPEYRNGKKRVLDLQLCVESGTRKPPVTLGDLIFRLEGDGNRRDEGLMLNQLLEKFVKYTEDGRDPFVTVTFANDLPVSILRELCAVLKTIDNESGIRIEAPPPGQLYYKAFSPNEEFLDRQKRLTQPWELKLSVADRVSGILVQIDAIWPPSDPQPTLKVREIPVPDPQSLRKELDVRGPGLPVILVLAPPGLTHGQLMTFIGPVLSTHNTIHVFVEREQPATGTPKP